jgi:hypothetical protein
MNPEKEAKYINTIFYADVLAMAVKNSRNVDPMIAGPLKAYLACREIGGIDRMKTSSLEGESQTKEGWN